VCLLPLPLLHLGACITVELANLPWMYMVYVDFPLSFLLLGLAWRFDNGLIVFGVFGTLWWYLLSRVVYSILRKMWKSN